MQLGYVLLPIWSDKPIAVEIVRTLPVHTVVRSLEGERQFERTIDPKTFPLYPTYDDAKRAMS
jgi:hypothetical protein